MRPATILIFLLTFGGAPAFAQGTGERFTDAADDSKIHASGFVCPSQIGGFERDAVGEHDAVTRADFCAYSALDGVYGTITLTPITGDYDPKSVLGPEFLEQEATGGKQVDESTAQFGGHAIYTRTYETTSLEDLRYRILFAGEAVGGYAVEATVEFATPRDDAFERDFLNLVYGTQAVKIGAAPAAAPRVKK